MFYWSIWSLVTLSPYLLGWWHDRGNLLYVTGTLFAVLMVLSLFSKGANPSRLTAFAVVLLFTLVNGILVVLVNPWIPALVYASIVIFHLIRPTGLCNPQLEQGNGAKGSSDTAGSTSQRIPDRSQFRGRVG
jgi:hypothetical protein